MAKIFITLTGTKHYFGNDFLEKGMKIRLEKEPDNEYDKEAIKVTYEGLGKIGYVANSSYTVIGESMSAGRLYDKIGDTAYLRVIRHVGNFKSELYDLSILVKDLKKSEEMEDKELANFFDWFFEIGYSEIVFADRAIFYEGDTERLYIRKVMTLEKYKKLKQQYVAFIQVGGAYAKNYEKLIKLLGIKSLIITDKEQ